MNVVKSFGFLLLISLTAAFYDDNDDVIEVTKLNFDQLVKGSDNVWIVQFYTTWCDASMNMTGEFKKAASGLKGAVKVGAVDADQHRIVAKKFNITEVPAIMIFSGEYSFPYFEDRSARALTELYTKVKNQLEKVTSRDSTSIKI